MSYKRNTPQKDGEFMSRIFVTPKKDGSYGLILSLKELNHWSEYNHFKMYGFQEILKFVARLCEMASLDIKDAYWIPVDEWFQKYLKFYWKDNLYQFCVYHHGHAGFDNEVSIISMQK